MIPQYAYSRARVVYATSLSYALDGMVMLQAISDFFLVFSRFMSSVRLTKQTRSALPPYYLENTYRLGEQYGPNCGEKDNLLEHLFAFSPEKSSRK